MGLVRVSFLILGCFLLIDSLILPASATYPYSRYRPRRPSYCRCAKGVAEAPVKAIEPKIVKCETKPELGKDEPKPVPAKVDLPPAATPVKVEPLPKPVEPVPSPYSDDKKIPMDMAVSPDTPAGVSGEAGSFLGRPANIPDREMGRPGIGVIDKTDILMDGGQPVYSPIEQRMSDALDNPELNEENPASMTALTRGSSFAPQGKWKIRWPQLKLTFPQVGQFFKSTLTLVIKACTKKFFYNFPLCKFMRDIGCRG